MKFRVSLKQLFFYGLLASPVWVMVLLAAQGKNWALMVLLAQLGMVFVGLVMLTLSLVSELLAHALYKRRLVAQKSSPQMAREIDHVHAGLESSESIRNNASQTSEGDNV